MICEQCKQPLRTFHVVCATCHREKWVYQAESPRIPYVCALCTADKRLGKRTQGTTGTASRGPSSPSKASGKVSQGVDSQSHIAMRLAKQQRGQKGRIKGDAA